MLNERTFAEILDDTIEETPDFSSGWESHLEPFGMAQLIAEVKIAPIYKVSLQKIYPKQRNSKPLQRRKSHSLDELQAQAFQLLANLSPALQDNFNLFELKSAYRSSVLKTHPDQGGNSETFQEVKKSYQILLALVKN